MKEYEELFANIWKQAVLDDIERSVKYLTDKGRWEAYKTFCKMSGNDEVSIEDKRYNKLFKDIKDYSKIKVRALEPRIKQLAYEESQEWPENNNMISRDQEYKDIRAELEQEVKEFAEKRMSGLWRRLA